MKILIYTPLFHPSVGGLENIVTALAEDFHRMGESVKVVCHTRREAPKEPFDFEVARFPSRGELYRLTRWADVYFQGCVSLKGLWPLALNPWKKYVITHQTWYIEPGKAPSTAGRMKQIASRLATLNISCSRAVAGRLGARGVVVPNFYDDSVFGLMPELPRDRDLVFVGRLVSDKGAGLLLEALSRLRAEGLTPTLTIVGKGPEDEALRRQAEQLGLASQVTFAGVKRGRELAALINAHRIQVVPSIWEEPFGIVALEGIACGCAIVCSAGGGLPEAAGPCGVTFPNGDVAALAARVGELLRSPAKVDELRAGATGHLQQHTRTAITKRYLDLIKNC